MLSYKALLAALILSLVTPGISWDQNPADAALVLEEDGDEDTEFSTSTAATIASSTSSAGSIIMSTNTITTGRITRVTKCPRCKVPLTSHKFGQPHKDCQGSLQPPTTTNYQQQATSAGILST